ncbi:hypothetical protein F8M41_000648 [Gigaspora margarita]|uniref:Uncharacterized protein n=1 Tax=Gigaspora margarita TaxID=4874 RepID=A0A8H4A9W7_GIGMA|nr:hypothetical protein F8M41_000648 [Gigaspora margarita]
MNCAKEIGKVSAAEIRSANRMHNSGQCRIERNKYKKLFIHRILTDFANGIRLRLFVLNLVDFMIICWWWMVKKCMENIKQINSGSMTKLKDDISIMTNKEIKKDICKFCKCEILAKNNDITCK